MFVYLKICFAQSKFKIYTNIFLYVCLISNTRQFLKNPIESQVILRGKISVKKCSHLKEYKDINRKLKYRRQLCRVVHYLETEFSFRLAKILK